MAPSLISFAGASTNLREAMRFSRFDEILRMAEPPVNRTHHLGFIRMHIPHEAERISLSSFLYFSASLSHSLYRSFFLPFFSQPCPSPRINTLKYIHSSTEELVRNRKVSNEFFSRESTCYICKLKLSSRNEK